MFKFGGSVVHLNPSSGAGDFAGLPSADQIWITDPTPEHLDLRAIRQISTDATQLIVDPASAEVLRGLVEVFTLPSGIPIRAGQVRLEALAACAAELLPEQIDLRQGNSYLAEFGSLRLLIASRGHLLPALRPHSPVDVALLVLNEATALGYSGG